MQKMRITNAQRKKNIIKNVAYLINSRGETKASFSARSGITRTTVYKILDGMINNVQQATVNKISDFFGISCDEIECYDLEEVERKSETVSLDGNKNPSAVPIIPETEFIYSLDKTIGYLVTEYPLTYIFTSTSNVVGLKVENDFCDMFSAGDILIIKRFSISKSGNLHIYVTSQNKLVVKNKAELTRNNTDHLKFLGFIMEERV